MIVALDPASPLALPQYPFTRRIHAQVIDQLHAAGARLIVYDIGFDRPSTPAADSALRAAARAAAPVVFVTSEIEPGGGVQILGGNDALRRIGAYPAAGLLPLGPDGVFRNLLGQFFGLPSVARVVQRLVTGRDLSPQRIRAAGAWIDYAGPPGTYPTIPFAAVAGGHFDRALVRGKIVVVGATAPVLQDVHPTAVGGGDMPGAEIQANAIATLLEGLPLTDASSALEITLIILTAAGLAAAAFWLDAVTVGALGLIGILAWGGLTLILFDHGTVLGFTPELLTIVVATGGSLLVAGIEDARERRHFRELFATGSPELVSQVLDRDSRLSAWASRIVDGYRIEEELGSGGMGTVYRATQLDLDRPVAIKLIRPDKADSAEHRARFEIESRAAAAIEHPNVVPIYDTGRTGHLLYIVMRLVDGHDLGNLIRWAPLDPATTVHIVNQLASALDAAHAIGIIHRDVKPANVLLTNAAPPHAYLTDFGVAKWAALTSELTQTRQWVGTLAYAAPEQIRGASVDARSDVYALAAVLYASLTGVAPSPLDSGVQPPSEVNPHLPVALDAVIARGLAADRTDRFATAGELARAAASALGMSPATTQPPGLPGTRGTGHRAPGPTEPNATDLTNTGPRISDRSPTPDEITASSSDAS